MKKIHPYYFVFFSVILFGLNSCASVEDYLAVDTNSANNDGIYTSSSDNGARYNVNSNSNDSYLADKYLDAVPSESYYSLDSAGIERSSIVYYDEDYVSSNNSITESSNQNSSSTNFLTSGISLGLGFGMGSMGYGGYPPMYGSPGYGYGGSPGYGYGGYPGYSYGGYPSYGFGGYPGYGYGGYPGYGGSYPGTPIYPGGENKPNIKREKRYSRTGGSNKSNYANGIKYDYSKAEREYSKKSYTKNNKSSKSNYSKYRSTNKRSNSNQYRSNNNSKSNRSYQNNSNNFNNNSAPSRSSSPSRSISPSRSSSGGSKRSR